MRKEENLITESDGRDVVVGSFQSNYSDSTVYYKKNTPQKSLKNKKTYNVVILHDFYDYHDRYLELGDFLIKKLKSNLNIVWMDFSGHGQSTGTRGHTGSFDNFCYDTLSLLDRIHEDHNHEMILLGQGMGGLVLLKLLDHIMGHEQEVSYNIAGLVYLNPFINFNYNIPEFKIPYVDIVAPFLSRFKMPLKLEPHQLCNDPIRNREMQKDGLINTQISLGMIKEIFEAAKSIRRSSYFIQHPCLFLVGEKDFLTSAEKIYLFQKGVSHELSTYKSYADAKHDLVNDINREIVFNDIVKWLNKIKIK